MRTVLPSGTSMVLPWTATLAVTAPARNVLTCSVSVAGASLSLLPGVGLGLSDATLALVGEASVLVSLDAAATRANVSLPHAGLRAAGGANAPLVLTCRAGCAHEGERDGARCDLGRRYGGSHAVSRGAVAGAAGVDTDGGQHACRAAATRR